MSFGGLGCHYINDACSSYGYSSTGRVEDHPTIQLTESTSLSPECINQDTFYRGLWLGSNNGVTPFGYGDANIVHVNTSKGLYRH